MCPTPQGSSFDLKVKLKPWRGRFLGYLVGLRFLGQGCRGFWRYPAFFKAFQGTVLGRKTALRSKIAKQ